MVLWHLGAGALITYLALGRRRIDYRFVLVGAAAPDAVDGVLGALLFDARADRFAGHSLAAPVAAAVAVVVLTRGRTRLSLFGIAVGWLTHLVADGMWDAPVTFLWPAFGIGEFSPSFEPYGRGLFTRPGAHLGTWAGEIAGAAVLLWFAVAFRLRERDRLASFLADGELRA